MRTIVKRRDAVAPARRPPGRHLGVSVVVVVLAMLAAACSGGGHGTTRLRPAAHAQSRTAAAAPKVTITPANGAARADPSAGITVTAAGGTLTNVTVRTPGGAVTGHLSQGGKVWHSRWALDVSQTYTVTATASRTGSRPVTAVSRFRT